MRPLFTPLLVFGVVGGGFFTHTRPARHARPVAPRIVDPDADVALIPVGPAGRHPWIERIRRPVHATPREALELFDAVGAQWMVPIHERAVAAHDRGRWVRILGVGDTTEFLY